jgi:hypothetical protein
LDGFLRKRGDSCPTSEKTASGSSLKGYRRSMLSTCPITIELYPWNKLKINRGKKMYLKFLFKKQAIVVS